MNSTHVPVLVFSIVYAIKPSRFFSVSRVLPCVLPGVTVRDWMGTEIIVLLGVFFGWMGPVPAQNFSPYSIHISSPVFIVAGCFYVSMFREFCVRVYLRDPLPRVVYVWRSPSRVGFHESSL